MPGGRLFLREGHQVWWSVGDRRDDLIALEHSSFEQPDRLVFDDDASYVDLICPLSATVTHEWTHASVKSCLPCSTPACD